MKLKTLFIFVIALFVCASPVDAFEIRQRNDIAVPKDTVIQGSLVTTGNSVIVDGTINGDLYCAGQTIDIRGTVNGDVLCAGQTLIVSGVVDGNVRSLGQLLTITGTVVRNVVFLGQTVTAEGSVGRELMAAGQTIRVNGPVAGDVTGYGQTISLGERARIGGNLTYTSSAELSEASGAAVVGNVTHLLPPKESKELSQMNQIRPKILQPVTSIGSVFFLLCVGLLVVWITKDKGKNITTQMLARPWFDGFIGFLTIIGTPIVIILLAITIIGIPVAILLGIAFAVALLLSRIYVSYVVGQKILKTASPYWQVVLGVVVLEILSHIPILGFLIASFASVWGLGGIVMSFGKRKAK